MAARVVNTFMDILDDRSFFEFFDRHQVPLNSWRMYPTPGALRPCRCVFRQRNVECGNRDETWFQIVHGIVISLHQIETEAISRLLSDDWELTAHIGNYRIYTDCALRRCARVLLVLVLQKNIISQTEGQACQSHLQCQVELLGHQLELLGQGWQLSPRQWFCVGEWRLDV